jgi:hypothetical protein
MDSIIKSPSEKFPVYLDFAGDLAVGETILSKSVTCIDTDTGVDSKTTIVFSETIASPDVVVVLQSGVEGGKYHIQCVATTNHGSIYQRDLLIIVQSVVDDYFTKQPDDAFMFDVDYTRRLSLVDSIAAASVTAIKESDGTSANVTSTPQIVTPKVGVPVYGGMDGNTYLLAIAGITTFGYVHEKFVRMNVQEF